MQKDFIVLFKKLKELQEKTGKHGLSIILPAKNEENIEKVMKVLTKYLIGNIIIEKPDKRKNMLDVLKNSPIKEIQLIDASLRGESGFVDTKKIALESATKTLQKYGIFLSEIGGILPIRVSRLREQPELTKMMFQSSFKKYSENFIEGKGAGMYQGIYLTTSDYVCFCDCDTKNFSENFIFPLFKEYFLTNNSFITTHYKKGKYYNKEICAGAAGKTTAGRIQRLVFNVITKTLSEMKLRLFQKKFPIYALSGEFVLKKKIAEKIFWPTKYEIETTLNLFIIGNKLPVGDVCLRFRRNTPQTDEKLEEMAYQIFDSIFSFCKLYSMRDYLKIKEKRQEIVRKYEKNGIEASLDDIDKKRVKRYKLKLEEAFRSSRCIFLPPLKNIDYKRMQNKLIKVSSDDTRKLLKKYNLR